MQQRLMFIKTKHETLSVRRRCQLLGLNRSTMYYQHKEATESNWLMNLIRDIWLQHPFYGYRKITVVLMIEHQLAVNRKRVLRLMKMAGIQAICPKIKLSQINPDHRKYPYLLRHLSINRVNQVWMTDITYLKLNTRFVYLVALIDVYSRYIVGWNLSFELDTDNCLSALQMALMKGVPDIINSDQGSQLTSESWIMALKERGIQISMDGKGRCKDNIYIERFWRTIKYEAIYLNEYNDYRSLYLGIKDYIEFYNEKRPHQSLKYRTPKTVYMNRSKGAVNQLKEGTKNMSRTFKLDRSN